MIQVVTVAVTVLLPAVVVPHPRAGVGATIRLVGMIGTNETMIDMIATTSAVIVTTSAVIVTMTAVIASASALVTAPAALTTENVTSKMIGIAVMMSVKDAKTSAKMDQMARKGKVQLSQSFYFTFSIITFFPL